MRFLNLIGNGLSWCGFRLLNTSEKPHLEPIFNIYPKSYTAIIAGSGLVVVLLYPRVRRILRLFKEKSFNASVDDLLVPSSAC